VESGGPLIIETIKQVAEATGSAFGPLVTITGAAAIFAGRYFWKSFGPIPNYRRLYVVGYGFFLPKRWQVHHINGDRRDNRAANLVAVPYGLHRAYHSNEFALGKVEFLVRNGNGGAFQKARTAADEMLKAAEFIGLCYENRKNAAKLKRIDELFDGRNDSTPDRDPWQI